MPLFRRRPAEPAALIFTVGVDGHRVMVGGPEFGCAMLHDLDAYIDKVAERTPPSADGRDSVALQSAKLDYVEMVDSMLSVLSLALEELEQRDIVSSDGVPSKPEVARLDRNLPTYEYIQASYARAQLRCGWARQVDRILAERGVAVLWPESESHERPV